MQVRDFQRGIPRKAEYGEGDVGSDKHVACGNLNR
jgi:hypothetical protein